jgi:hypothetical protein
MLGLRPRPGGKADRSRSARREGVPGCRNLLSAKRD